ncbi:Methionine gamma-lyase [Thalictrum thalictroides]|uniref:Methionine gamma-lyase n=1 Tax=Thalictrum thalictroides TaxID=46969 RepID=A0A7J6UQU8_THATH|nr:Methionine gamma-lyase [Thalictrum thalictroides]
MAETANPNTTTTFVLGGKKRSGTDDDDVSVSVSVAKKKALVARLGADVVVHSISKYISGGADIIAGAVCGPASLVNSMMDLHQGLEDHPQHKLLKSLANKEYGYGGILCLDMETEERANRLMYHLQNCTQFGFMAVSLGYYETLMSCSGSSTSSEMNAEEKELAGISPGLVRMSIGYTGTLEQRWSQFEKALGRMQDTGLFNKN